MVLFGVILSIFNLFLNLVVIIYCKDLLFFISKKVCLEEELIVYVKKVFIIMVIVIMIFVLFLMFGIDGIFLIIKCFVGFVNILIVVLFVVGLFNKIVFGLVVCIVLFVYVILYFCIVWVF